MMLKLRSIFVFFFFSAPLFAQQPAKDAEARQHYTKMERCITMRDGKKLFTSIYLPKDKSVKYPIITTRTPYNVAPCGEDKYKTSLAHIYVHERGICLRMPGRA